jgi:hypothetical protein
MITHTNYSQPQAERRVVLAYKNMPVAHHVSHIGLGVSALNTAKVLRANGIYTDVWPILGAKQLADRIAATNPQPSHIVLGAPWIKALDLQAYLVFRFPQIQFAVTCHSNVGFLGADPQAITNFRDDLDLEQGALNFQAAGNSQRFCNFILNGYGRPCTYLPNLYYLGDGAAQQRRNWSGGTLRVGSFGAVRPLKNHISAAAAALQLSDKLHTNVEFHISVGRIEGGYTVVRAIEAMLGGSPAVKLVKDDWYQWPKFRHVVKSMHILLQPSFTETFNMVTADGASESVPSVVSDAIEWAPDHWKADCDDPLSIARIAKQLIFDTDAGPDGFKALQAHDVQGLRAWKAWIGC